jgi:Family of unknown function (DUF5371)
MATGDSTVEIVFAQVSLPKSQLEKLKQRSGMITTEEALQTAVSHYLGCPEIGINLISGSARGEEEVRGREREREKEKEGGEGEGLILVAGKTKTPNHGYVHGYEHETNQNQKLLAIEMEIVSQRKQVRI